MLDTYTDLYKIADGLIKKYPNTSDDVFKFLARLADELRDVLVGVLAIARYTDTEAELLESIERRHEKLVTTGFIDEKEAVLRLPEH